MAAAAGRKRRCGCVVDAHGHRTTVCRIHAEYWCDAHGIGFTAANRAGIHARSHGRTLREAVADGIMWARS